MLLYCFDAEFLRHGEIIPAKKKTNVSLFFSGVDSDYWSKKKPPFSELVFVNQTTY